MAIQLDRQIMQAPGVRARVGALYESGLGRTAEFSDRTPTPRPSLKAFLRMASRSVAGPIGNDGVAWKWRSI